MCDKIKQCNLGSVVELIYYSNSHFQQLFIAHEVYIIEFLRGCRSIIAIDSTHMSGSYGGALLSATSYDANDCMFLVAFGVMSSKNYED